MKHPGSMALVALVGVVAIGYEVLSSSGHLLHAHLGGWWDYAVAILTVLAIGFAALELCHKAEVLTKGPVLHSIVTGVTWTLMSGALISGVYGLFTGGWKPFAFQLAFFITGFFFGVVKQDMDDAVAPSQITFDEWQELDSLRARWKAEAEYRERVQAELERDPDYRATMRIPMQGRIRAMM